MDPDQFAQLMTAITADLGAVRAALGRIEAALRAIEPNPDQLMTTEEAAEYLGVSEHTMQKLARRGRIPAVQITKGYRFYRRDLRALALRQDERE
jgi:excisionase family DNA binding protein